MWCTRIYKNDNTNKIERFRIYDETRGEYQEFGATDIRNALTVTPNLIYNIQLDDYGKIKMVDMNNNKMKYHSKTYLADELVAYHYIIVLGHKGGLLRVIADSYYTDTITLNEVTLSALIDRLKINTSLSHLKLYNGFIDNSVSKLSIIYFNGNNFVKVPNITESNKKQMVDTLIDNDVWEYEVEKMTNEGLYLSNLETKEDTHSIQMPTGIVYLREFGGGVNNIKLSDSLQSLGKRCFYDLDDIIKVVLSSSLKVIPDECFYQSSLQDISFSGYEEEIGEYAFADTSLKCSIITNARIIKNNAFEGVRSRVLKLPKIEKIYSEAFSLSKLEKVEFGKTLKKIDTFAFANCNYLYNIKFNSPVVINANAFTNCPKLKEVNIPKGSKIHKSAFDKKCKINYIS